MRPFRLSLPVDAPPRIAQPFGVNWTGIPDYYSRYGLPGHEGIDYGGDLGDPIYAAAEGTIQAINIPGQNGVAVDHAYGRHIIIAHPFGDAIYKTQYCHLNAVITTINVGSKVTAGQRIGSMGNTGNVVDKSKYHLHFMLRHVGASARGETNYPNDIIDPAPYLPAR